MPPPAPIAIVGMACRFPGASSPSAFWNLLTSGRQTVGPVPPERWSSPHFHDASRDRPGMLYFKEGNFLDQPLDHFDAAFFHILPVEARVMDPQIRLTLEVVWEAFEHAGIPPAHWKKETTGVYLSSFQPDYFLLQGQNFNAPWVDSLHATGTSLSMVANRVSYTYDFGGPSLAIDTACSASLSAIYLACRELWSGAAQHAVTGGVSLMVYPNTLAPLCRAHFLSPDGRSKTFDARADGYGRGEGVGILLLCPLDIAEKENLPIQALILAAAANQDGRTNGISVPNPDAQARLITQAWHQAGLNPSHASVIEAHGTGTPVGDPIEARAIGQAIGQQRPRDNPCLISSAKANIGHLEAAAGVAAVIKTVLSLQHGRIPALAGLDQPNPAIPFDELNLKLPRQLEPWPDTHHPRTAGVNGFGYGGSNCHLVLQQAPPRPPTPPRPPIPAQPLLLPLSAETPQALTALTQNLTSLKPPPHLPDLAHTLGHHRTHHTHRAALWGTPDQIQTALHALAHGATEAQTLTGTVPQDRPKLAFVFTGMGPQTWNMARSLIETEPLFYKTIENIDAHLHPSTNTSILSELTRPESTSRLHQPAFAQTANFAIQVALVELWKSYGIQPDAVIGHSVGEVTAAYISGALLLSDALLVSHHRGQLQQTTARDDHAMLATGLSPDQATALLNDGASLDLAAINSPLSTTLSGPITELESVARTLERENIFARLMKTRVAYHSRAMDPVRESLLSSLKHLQPQTPSLPLYSTVLAAPFTESGFPNPHFTLNADYWWANVRQPVRFSDTVQTMISDGYTLFLEVGPHPALNPSLQQIFSTHPNRTLRALASLHHRKPDRIALLETAAHLYTLGFDLNWSRLNPPGLRIPFPTYPWQHESYWFTTPGLQRWTHPHDDHPLLGQRDNSPSPSWTARPTFTLHPWLLDHRIDQLPLFPAAAWIELAIAATHQIDQPISLHSLNFEQALTFDEGPYPLLKTSITDQTLAIHSQHPHDEASQTWHRHFTAAFAEPTPPPKPFLWNQALETFADPLTPEAFREALSGFSLQYGPAFQGLLEARSNPKEGAARLQLHHSLDPAPWHLHPCLLDLSFQFMLFLLTRQHHREGHWLPVAIQHIALFQSAPAEIIVRGLVTEVTPTLCRGDLFLHSPDGQPIAQLLGTTIRKIIPPQPLRHDIIYTDAWTPFLQPESNASTTTHSEQLSCPSPSTSHSLIETVTSESLALLARIIAQLETAQATPSNPLRYAVITRGALTLTADDPAPKLIEASLWGLLRCIMKERTDLDLLALDLPANPAQDPSKADLTRFLQATPFPKEAAYRHGTFLLREIIRVAVPHPPFEERSRAATGRSVSPPQNHQRTASHSQVIPHDRQNSIPQGGRGSGPHDPRESDRDVLPSPHFNRSYLFPPNQTAWITGGLGEVGFTLARWILNQGGRHILLTGRTPPDPQRLAELNELNSQGAHIQFLPCDIANETDARRILDTLTASLAPLGSIIHAAGILRNAFIHDLDPATFRAPLESKIAGAWNLHTLTQDLPLQHFILISSIASSWGSPGQGNYGAGNAFLDALAHLRRRQGLPALALSFGALAGARSMAERTHGNAEKFFESMGLPLLPLSEALPCIESALKEKTPHLTLAAVEWPEWLNTLPHAGDQIRFGKLAAETLARRTQPQPTADHPWTHADPVEKEKQILEALRQVIADETGLPLEKINPSLSLRGLGIDSLSSVAIDLRIRQTFGVTIPFLQLFQEPNLHAIATRINSKVEPRPASRPPTSLPQRTLASSKRTST